MRSMALLLEGVRVIGFLVLTFLYKIAITVGEQNVGVAIKLQVTNFPGRYHMISSKRSICMASVLPSLCE